MIITNFNLSGFTEPKLSSIQLLLESSDLVCTTETWSKSIGPLPDSILTEYAPAYSSTNRPRLGGGVAVFFKQPRAFRKRLSISNPHFQVLIGTFMRTTIIVAYVKPQASRETLNSFFLILAYHARGPTTIVGDFNARHSSWDHSTNPQGSGFLRWCTKAHLVVLAPQQATFSSHRGSSVVDIFLVKGLSPGYPSVVEGSWPSDHRPVRVELPLSTPSTLKDRIPHALLKQPRLQQDAKRSYTDQLPPIGELIRAASSPTDLEQATHRLGSAILRPWLGNLSLRPGRSKPGWSYDLDQMAKTRTQLLRSKCPQDRASAKDLDRKIKRQFRRNRRRILAEQRDELLEGSPEEFFQRLKRLSTTSASLNTTSPRALNPDAYTHFLQAVQSDTEPIQPQPFLVPHDFQTLIARAIINAKKKKAPGPDHIPTELLQLDPKMFSSIINDLWAAVGRVAYVPLALRSGFVAPIFKKGDARSPDSYRPIVLLSTLRKMATKAIHYKILDLYMFHRNQWGFIRGSNTELAAAYACRSFHAGLQRVASLDLKGAYDSVPRKKLLEAVHSRIQDPIVGMLPSLLTPIKLRTLRQTSTTTATIVVGVPQGDPLSPTLFNIFMDGFLELLNTIPRSLSSCFADDVLLLAESSAVLQSQLTQCTHWAFTHGMKWNPSKSFILGHTRRRLLFLDEHPLPFAEVILYLGFSFDHTGLSHHKLLARITSARTSLRHLRRLTAAVPLPLSLRHQIIRSKVLPLCDYCLPLQPWNTEVSSLERQLELESLSWILDTKITPRTLERARLLIRTPSMQVRRNIQTVSLAARFHSRYRDPTAPPDALRREEKQRSQRAWIVIKDFLPLPTILQDTVLPTLQEDVPHFIASSKEILLTECFAQGNIGRRRVIPLTKNHLPLLSSTMLSRQAIHEGILWYLATLPIRSEPIRNLLPSLKRILELPTWTAAQEQEASDILEKCAHLRNSH